MTIAGGGGAGRTSFERRACWSAWRRWAKKQRPWWRGRICGNRRCRYRRRHDHRRYRHHRYRYRCPHALGGAAARGRRRRRATSTSPDDAAAGAGLVCPWGSGIQCCHHGRAVERSCSCSDGACENEILLRLCLCHLHRRHHHRSGIFAGVTLGRKVCGLGSARIDVHC